jgi:hypothetical protein
MADTEDMNREGAETYLRLLAEATMRRSLEAAREPHGPLDPSGPQTRLLTVGQALATVGALDLTTLEEILVDFDLAMSVRELADPASQGPGQSGGAARAARLVTRSQSVHQLPLSWAVGMRLGQWPAGTADPGPEPGRPEPGGPEPGGPEPGGPGAERPEAGTGPGGAPADQFVPVGLTVPFHDGAISGALYLMAFVRTGAGSRFFALWNVRTPPRSDATLIPFGGFTVTDDRGARYQLEFMPNDDAAWASEVGLRPAPPPGTRWLDVTAPGSKPVRVGLDPGCPAVPERPSDREAKLSPGELLLVMLAERLLTAVPDYPQSQWRPQPGVASPALRGMAARLGDIVAALEAADVLSPLSPVPGRLATLCVSLDIPGHGITAPLARRLPEPWLSVLAHYQRRKPDPIPLLEGYAAMTAVLPELDGIRLTLLGLHHAEAGSALHVLVRGQLSEALSRPPPGPLGVDMALPLSIWLRDSGGRWHTARPADRHRGDTKDGECTVRLQLAPPLTRATPWAEILAGGQSAEVRATVPLRWGFPP